MTQDNHDNTDNRLVHAYNKMMERVKSAIDQSEKNLPSLLEKAQDKAVALGELTKHEAEHIGQYLKRDVEAAADYFTSKEAEDLAAWFKFDVALVEERLLEMFLSVADKTKIELINLDRRAREYHTGEVAGMGTLKCIKCDQEMHFHTTTHIPPCPKCHATTFMRVTD